MYSDFEDVNSYVFLSAQGAVLDCLIWCLGPYVDRGRDYGLFRVCLARTTRSVVRVCWGIRD